MELVIMRGIPGSGKSTWAHSQAGAVVCSADDYFLINGVYGFDYSKLPEAHRACQQRCLDIMQTNVPLIIIDNTNIKRWEYAPYVQLANRHGYEVYQKVCGGSWSSTHNIPVEVIARMLASFEIDTSISHYVA